jgi:hypothetical protein
MIMRFSNLAAIGAIAAAIGGFVAINALAQGETSGEMSFFVTSVGLGDGANLGGLEGADAHCQALAMAAGAGDQNWLAYLSTLDTSDAEGVDARDRLGEGPWFNADGVLIANDLAQLHSDEANITLATGLTEAGGAVNGRGQTPLQHDILTGTRQDGRAVNGTCANWTSNNDADFTYVGHHDLVGNSAGINYWNYSHRTAGCSQEALVRTGGAGYFYCFAAD